MESRIKPIDKPKGIVQILAFRFFKKEFGKVITPAKVLYARYPSIMFMVKKLYDTEDKFKNILTEQKFIIQNFVATINGCTFCMDISKKRVISKQMSLDKFIDLLNFKNNNLFSEKEKAMLTYVKEATSNVLVKDETYNELKKHFSDNEIIEITYVSAAENFLNRLVKPIGIGSDELCEIKK